MDPIETAFDRMPAWLQAATFLAGGIAACFAGAGMGVGSFLAVLWLTH
jgi:hypothetical protein